MNTPLIVIGMHRSGTSMLTRFVQDLGYFIGHNQDRAHNDESFMFQKINDWIFFQKNITWDNVYNQQFVTTRLADELASVVKDYLTHPMNSRRFIGGKFGLLGADLCAYKLLWGWKDPKTTINLDVWSRVFPQAKVIHIYRNPIDIAQSLKTREIKLAEGWKGRRATNKIKKRLLKSKLYGQSPRVMNLEESYLLWKDYTKLAFSADAHFGSVLHVQYEDLMTKPKEELIGICKMLSVHPEPDLLEKIERKMQPDRCFPFIKDSSLHDFYKKVQKEELMKTCNYHNLL